MENNHKKKIGLYGGAFDPVHMGHLLTAERVREVTSLDRIVFIPTHIHPIKGRKQIASPVHRLNMLKLAIQNNPFFGVSDIELNRKQVSYTVDTIKEFQRKYAAENVEFYFLVGADNVKQFHLWKQAEDLCLLCQFIAFGRPGVAGQSETSDPYTSRFRFVEMPLWEFSSTEIRRRLREGKSIKYWVLPEVEKYIKKYALYQDNE